MKDSFVIFPNVDEIEFLRYIKDVDDQDVLDSMSVLRRRAGLKVTIPLPPLQMASGCYESGSCSDNTVVHGNSSLFFDDEDDDDEQRQVMACYRVPVQIDNGLAPTEQKSEVSRYAFDELLQQDYLEEFDFVPLDEDTEEHNVKNSTKECPSSNQEVPHTQSSFLSSWLNLFFENVNTSDATSETRSSRHDWQQAKKELGKVHMDSSSASLNLADSTEFQGTLNALSSVFSGLY